MGDEPEPLNIGGRAASSQPESVPWLLKQASQTNRLLIQPRCGVGSQIAMASLLQKLEKEARPDILSITVDSYTRLGHFQTADRLLRDDPDRLNGYPLVAHGSENVQALISSVGVPLQVRHGSPDPRKLFDVSIRGGITAFEGGGIGYNLPYCKDVPLLRSLHDWDEIDVRVGELTGIGQVIDREFFGTLSGSLIPPSLAIVTTFLEAILAARRGVKSLSIAIAQSGNLVQDIAALRAIRTLAPQFLPAEVDVFPVLHQFMGAFPSKKDAAEGLIILGSIAAVYGRAVKVINKTHEEASGIPSVSSNIQGVLLTRAASSFPMRNIDLRWDLVEEEVHWISREVVEILSPILQVEDTFTAIADAFASGALDIPFCPSVYCAGDIVTGRDPSGAVRYLSFGGISLSAPVRERNERMLGTGVLSSSDLYLRIRADLLAFASDHEVPRDNARF